MDETRLLRVRLDLAAKTVDGVIDSPRDTRIRIFPHGAEQFVATNDASKPFGQVFEERKFAMREMNLLRPAAREM